MKRLLLAFILLALPAFGQDYVPRTSSGTGSGDMLGANNLSDVASPSTSLTNLGGTTAGKSIFSLTNPGAITFLRINADNSVTARSAANFRSDIGAGTSSFDGVFASLTSKPTTAAGYGITNGAAIDTWGGKTAPSGTVIGTTDTQTESGKTFTAPIFSAGTASASTAPKLTSGTLNTTPEAGAIEYDGAVPYFTADTTNGRTQGGNQNIFLLTANGSALGPTIADFFGTNSAIPTVTNGIYVIDFYCYYLKTTGGAVTYTVTNTQTYTNLVAHWLNTAASTGLAGGGSTLGGVVTTTTAAAALPATSSLTTGTNQYVEIHATAECATAGNIRLQVTSSAGTVTPLRGSKFFVRRIGSANVGTFVP